MTSGGGVGVWIVVAEPVSLGYYAISREVLVPLEISAGTGLVGLTEVIGATSGEVVAYAG